VPQAGLQATNSAPPLATAEARIGSETGDGPATAAADGGHDDDATPAELLQRLAAELGRHITGLSLDGALQAPFNRDVSGLSLGALEAPLGRHISGLSLGALEAHLNRQPHLPAAQYHGEQWRENLSLRSTAGPLHQQPRTAAYGASAADTLSGVVPSEQWASAASDSRNAIERFPSVAAERIGATRQSGAAGGDESSATGREAAAKRGGTEAAAAAANPERAVAAAEAERAAALRYDALVASGLHDPLFPPAERSRAGGNAEAGFGSGNVLRAAHRGALGSAAGGTGGVAVCGAPRSAPPAARELISRADSFQHSRLLAGGHERFQAPVRPGWEEPQQRVRFAHSPQPPVAATSTGAAGAADASRGAALGGGRGGACILNAQQSAASSAPSLEQRHRDWSALLAPDAGDRGDGGTTRDGGDREEDEDEFDDFVDRSPAADRAKRGAAAAVNESFDSTGARSGAAASGVWLRDLWSTTSAARATAADDAVPAVSDSAEMSDQAQQRTRQATVSSQAVAPLTRGIAASHEASSDWGRILDQPRRAAGRSAGPSEAYAHSSAPAGPNGPERPSHYPRGSNALLIPGAQLQAAMPVSRLTPTAAAHNLASGVSYAGSDVGTARELPPDPAAAPPTPMSALLAQLRSGLGMSPI